MTPLNIFENQYAFTSSDATHPVIRTGCFGPCYVVTFTSGKFAAMAHMNQNINTETIRRVFNAFKEQSIEPKNVKVSILGGWKKDEQSSITGINISTFIAKLGCQEVDTSRMHKKEVLPESQYMVQLSESETAKYYYFGATIDSRTGETALMDKEIIELSLEQLKRSEKMDLSKIYGLTRVSESKSKS